MHALALQRSVFTTSGTAQPPPIVAPYVATSELLERTQESASFHAERNPVLSVGSAQKTIRTPRIHVPAKQVKRETVGFYSGVGGGITTLNPQGPSGLTSQKPNQALRK